MFVPFHGDGIISQFEGYEELEELDWDAYRAKYGNIQRLDRILRAEGDDPDRYKVAKQADTVMLFFLFSGDELRRALRAARATTTCRHGAQEHRLLRPAHLARLDAELRHPRGGPRRAGPGELVGAVPRRAAERCRRHPGRDHEGGHPHGRHVRDARPRAAQLRGHPHPRRRPVLRPQAPGASSTGLSFSMQFRETPILVTLAGDRLTLAVHPEGVSRPSGSASATTSASSCRATGTRSSCSRTRAAEQQPPQRLRGGTLPKIPGSDLRRRRGARRLAAREGVARVAARADGVRTGATSATARPGRRRRSRPTSTSSRCRASRA